MKIDIIITTYNRPDNVLCLVNQLNQSVKCFNIIIVVDSSDDKHEVLGNNNIVTYIRSFHKNQPYQRFLGLLNSNADWVLYLDDDLEIIKYDFLAIFSNLIKNDPSIVGIGSSIYFPGQKAISRKWWRQVALWFTGEPFMKKGKLSLFGEFGGYTGEEVMDTEALSGGCMLLKRSIAKDIFSDTLFSLFEKRWAMGEDKYLSYQASRRGKLLLVTEPVVAHPPIESTYFVNEMDFQARVLYSRLWLAVTIAPRQKVYVLIKFLYYAFWRVLISGTKGLFGNKSAKNKFFGNLLALKRITLYGFDAQKITPGILWDKEFEKNNG